MSAWLQYHCLQQLQQGLVPCITVCDLTVNTLLIAAVDYSQDNVALKIVP